MLAFAIVKLIYPGQEPFILHLTSWGLLQHLSNIWAVHDPSLYICHGCQQGEANSAGFTPLPSTRSNTAVLGRGTWPGPVSEGSPASPKPVCVCVCMRKYVL